MTTRTFVCQMLIGITCMLTLQSPVAAEGVLVKVPTRPDVKTALFWESVEGAKATVFLFPGGGGGFGKVENGRPTSNNVLVRSVPYFR